MTIIQAIIRTSKTDTNIEDIFEFPVRYTARGKFQQYPAQEMFNDILKKVAEGKHVELACVGPET